MLDINRLSEMRSWLNTSELGGLWQLRPICLSTMGCSGDTAFCRDQGRMWICAQGAISSQTAGMDRCNVRAKHTAMAGGAAVFGGH